MGVAQQTTFADNHLLSAVTAAEGRRLLGSPALVTMTRGTALFRAGDALSAIWFPVSGLVTLEHIAPDGATLELCAIGREGLIGVPSTSGDVVLPYGAVVRVPGRAYRLRVGTVAEALRHHAGFQQAVLTYLGQAVTRVALEAHCLHAHPLLERLARWLLLAGAGATSQVLEITHEELSRALGCCREVVSRAMGELEEAGAVWRQPERILLLDQDRLEKTACGCYLRRGRHDDGAGRERAASVGRS